MLSFEEKKAIFHLFKLKEKKFSNGKVNFLYPDSKQKGQVLAKQLQPSGNGYVIGKYMTKEVSNEYKVDARGWISIKEFSNDGLKKVISEAMTSMSGITAAEDLYIKKQKTEEPLEKFVEPQKSIEAIIEPQQTSETKDQFEKETFEATNDYIKQEVLPTTICGNIAYSYLNNWMGFTVSVVDCGLMIWRMTARKYGVVGGKR
ncbi:hypothetical protein [Neobacillus sp. FSL H8-0543]|uniref:hypothetical protein n=1 Tax=Neobacillus sp. FSL H8-0543 TaxID=2954672 RepID=UPI0031590F54